MDFRDLVSNYVSNKFIKHVSTNNICKHSETKLVLFVTSLSCDNKQSTKLRENLWKCSTFETGI